MEWLVGMDWKWMPVVAIIGFIIGFGVVGFVGYLLSQVFKDEVEEHTKKMKEGQNVQKKEDSDNTKRTSPPRNG
jgi:H+/gluconate symporter-like permease